MNNLNIRTKNDQTHLTPPDILKPLGVFDLDPCASLNRPWDTAKKHYTIEDDGLLMPWDGRVWCNPPYKFLKPWMNKMALHGDGIALTFARTETQAFQNFVFPYAESILFVKGRIVFHDAEGKPQKSNAGAPSVLISYGEYNADVLEESGILGWHQPLKKSLFVFGVIAPEPEGTWKVIVEMAMIELAREADLEDIYQAVMKLAPKKVSRNNHYREKIRQTLQMYFTRVGRGRYKC